MTDVAKHERNAARLERLLSALAGAKDLRPGIVTRRLVDAVVRIPWLTAEWVARPRIAPLAKRIGLTSTMVSQKRARALEKSSLEENFAAGFAEERREERLLEDLNALLESASPTPEDVLSLLSGEPPNLSKVLADTRDRQTTRFAKRGADAKHAPYKNKRERLRAKFATGKYSSKMECAENEHEKLGIGYSTAIDYLKNEPKPIHRASRSSRSAR
jgi:hypothetical protein